MRLIPVLLGLALTLTLAAPAPAQEQSGADEAPRAVLVLTNHGTLGHTGAPTGFYLPEAAHPWKVLKDAGFSVTFASPDGGPVPMDPGSVDREDPMNAAFLESPAVRKALDHTTPLARVEPSEVDALVFAGGHGTMWDLPARPVVGDAIVRVDDAGGVVAAVCHGPACFVGVLDEEGEPWIAGRRVAAFTNEEERAVEMTNVVPFLLQTRLEELGAKVEAAPKFTEQVVVDERLVTGQNPSSAEKMAREIVKLVERR